MLTLKEFKEARGVLSGVIRNTSLVYSPAFSKATGNQIYIKPENMQVTGAYKIRGAYYKISTLSDEEKARGLVTASAGNHAQGVAYAAQAAGVSATIVMPTTTPLVKVNNTKDYGAKVVLHGETFDDAAELAAKLSEEEGLTYVHPFNDPAIATGQGTISYEIFQDLPDVDVILVPIGGGGLATGVSTLAKLLNPNVTVIGVEPSGAASMKASLDAGHVVTLDRVETIADGVAAMNAQVKELGLQHTHFANPHGISDEDHYTSCYDMAQILRWALTQPGFETLFTRNEMYTMAPTNVQPVTRYFHQQDKMRVASSRFYIPAILGSKIGYTNIARYSYVCLAEQNGVRLICVTMQSNMKTDKYNDVRTLLDHAFSTFTGYTEIPAQGVTAQLEVVGGGDAMGTVTVSDPGVRLLLANGLTAENVSVSLELPERYILGVDPEAYAVYTIQGGGLQETASVRVKAKIEGLEEVVAANADVSLPASRSLKKTAGGLIAISLGSTVLAAVVVFAVIRMQAKKKKRKPGSKH